MAKLTILRGVSGSGKSTWASAAQREATTQNTPVIVSRDRIRMCLFTTEAWLDEALITKVSHNMVFEALKAGRDVIVDDTNTSQQYVNAFIGVANGLHAEYEVVTLDVPLAIALKRNALRAKTGGRSVPEDVIGKQYMRLHGIKSSAVDNDPDNPDLNA